MHESHIYNIYIIAKQAYVPDLTFILKFKEVLAEIKTANGQDSNLYLNANDERRNAINTRAKRIHRDIKRKLHTVDQKWNQSGDTMGPCETAVILMDL